MHSQRLLGRATPLARLAIRQQLKHACPSYRCLLSARLDGLSISRSSLSLNLGTRSISDVADNKHERAGFAHGGHESPNARPASELSQTITSEEKSHYDRLEAHSKDAQRKSPWTRAGSDTAPVHKPRSASAMVKGKLLTTPSRMLKLILPLTPLDTNTDKKDVEPLALFVHPQQPLSYLERLIQSELPPVKDKHGNDKTPSVTFRAEDPDERDDDNTIAHTDSSTQRPRKSGPADDDTEYMRIDGRLQKTGRLSPPSSSSSSSSGPSSSDPHPDYEGKHFIRWSPSTEIGDFIRDASPAHIFLITLEGSPHPIPIAVPSFADRTFYLRMRLRKLASRIHDMSGVKSECDALARRGAKRVAQAGFCGLIGWWYLVYRLTFETDLGWDVMEPVTYLVGLSGLIGGYMWFLYHNREVSYRAAMKLTVSKRQEKLYNQRGFDIGRWEGLVEEANRLRREIKMVAEEYDVEWDESGEAGEDVREALREERRKGGKEKEGKKGEDDDDDD